MAFTQVPWTKVVGGRAAFDRAYGLIALEAQRRQLRLAAALDALGPPGEAGWDPMTAQIELRGHLFHAELLGTYDGQSWLWSWANLQLLIPDEYTTVARAARDAAVRVGVAAFSNAWIIDEDERIPAMMAGLVCAHGFADAFWVAAATQVYVFMPGQLDVKTPSRLATIYSAKRRSLREILAHLRLDKHLAKQPFEQIDRDDMIRLRGRGFELRIRRIDKLKDVMAESRSMPGGDGAPRATAMIILVESEMGPDYSETGFGTLNGVWTPTQMAGRAEIPWQALAAAEQLNRLDEVGLYDWYLRAWYPRA